jgi:hypothetical protein
MLHQSLTVTAPDVTSITHSYWPGCYINHSQLLPRMLHQSLTVTAPDVTSTTHSYCPECYITDDIQSLAVAGGVQSYTVTAPAVTSIEDIQSHSYYPGCYICRGHENTTPST